jgi:hypothetical protein
MMNINQLIIWQKQRHCAEHTRQEILAALSDGLLTVEDIINNPHLNNALFGEYYEGN